MQYNFDVTESALLTRSAAAKIKGQLEDHLGVQETTDLASLDLSAVEVMSETFADELFGGLVAGPVEEIRLCDKGCVLFSFKTAFGHHIELLGAKPAVIKVIEASLKHLAFEVIVSDLGEDFLKSFSSKPGTSL
jgi:hypothetical protein